MSHSHGYDRKRPCEHERDQRDHRRGHYRDMGRARDRDITPQTGINAASVEFAMNQALHERDQLWGQWVAMFRHEINHLVNERQQFQQILNETRRQSQSAVAEQHIATMNDQIAQFQKLAEIRVQQLSDFASTPLAAEIMMNDMNLTINGDDAHGMDLTNLLEQIGYMTQLRDKLNACRDRLDALLNQRERRLTFNELREWYVEYQSHRNRTDRARVLLDHFCHLLMRHLATAEPAALPAAAVAAADDAFFLHIIHEQKIYGQNRVVFDCTYRLNYLADGAYAYAFTFECVGRKRVVKLFKTLSIVNSEADSNRTPHRPPDSVENFVTRDQYIEPPPEVEHVAKKEIRAYLDLMQMIKVHPHYEDILVPFEIMSLDQEYQAVVRKDGAESRVVAVVMDYHETLFDVFKKKQSIPNLADLADCLRKIVCKLNSDHDLAHFDISLRNVVLVHGGLKLIDFGEMKSGNYPAIMRAKERRRYPFSWYEPYHYLVASSENSFIYDTHAVEVCCLEMAFYDVNGRLPDVRARFMNVAGDASSKEDNLMLLFQIHVEIAMEIMKKGVARGHVKVLKYFLGERILLQS